MSLHAPAGDRYTAAMKKRLFSGVEWTLIVIVGILAVGILGFSTTLITLLASM